LCLNLVTNAVMAWNTVRYQEILKQFKNEGYPLRAGDLAHLSPARHGHINPYGRYRFKPDPTPGSPEASSAPAV
jgi:Tn3 transposase DDE domain-containing protein